MRRHRVVLMVALVPYIRLYRRNDLVSNLAPYRYATNSIVLCLRRHLPTRIRCTVHVLTYVRVYSLCRPCVLSYRVVPPGISFSPDRQICLAFLSFFFFLFSKKFFVRRVFGKRSWCRALSFRIFYVYVVVDPRSYQIRRNSQSKL